ncbi:PilZ domain-containing protein [Sphingomonas pokkalii]|uniref:PilZ domain-containing protein n=1 Tax=Sphingomonas pokkalii TaxID=2175090 RepID=A0A2U0SI84_9SPHN|nr:PilZ domain-containing protein [Sphingomonas pokkalii]
MERKMGIAARLYQDGRWTERHQVELEATLRDSAWAPLDVVIEDVSPGGFRVVAGAQMAVGDKIALGVAGLGTREARVVWGDEGIYGCEFIVPLSKEDLHTAVSAPAASPIAFPKTPLPTPQATGVDAGTNRAMDEDRLPIRARVAAIVVSAFLAWVFVFAIGWGVLALVRALLG